MQNKPNRVVIVIEDAPEGAAHVMSIDTKFEPRVEKGQTPTPAQAAGMAIVGMLSDVVRVAGGEIETTQ